jgi:hypothetical protein
MATPTVPVRQARPCESMISTPSPAPWVAPGRPQPPGSVRSCATSTHPSRPRWSDPPALAQTIPGGAPPRSGRGGAAPVWIRRDPAPGAGLGLCASWTALGVVDLGQFDLPLFGFETTTGPQSGRRRPAAIGLRGQRFRMSPERSSPDDRQPRQGGQAQLGCRRRGRLSRAAVHPRCGYPQT